MKLTRKDVERFYRIFLPLLDYTNEQRGILTRMSREKDSAGRRLITPDMMRVTQSLWEDPSIIDDYLAAKPRLPWADRQAMLSWKRRVTGRFLVVPSAKREEAFFIGEEAEVYLVTSLRNTWDELLSRSLRPRRVEKTALLPYRGNIIFDGLLAVQEEPIDRKNEEIFREFCRRAVESGALITTL